LLEIVMFGLGSSFAMRFTCPAFRYPVMEEEDFHQLHHRFRGRVDFGVALENAG